MNSMKNVGEYDPEAPEFGKEHDPFVKVVDIFKSIDYTTTYGITRNGYYYGWYDAIVPYKKDIEEHGCSKEKIPYKKGDCLYIKGIITWRGTKGYFRDKDGNNPRWCRLKQCRVIENKGSTK